MVAGCSVLPDSGRTSARQPNASPTSGGLGRVVKVADRRLSRVMPVGRYLLQRHLVPAEPPAVLKVQVSPRAAFAVRQAGREGLDVETRRRWLTSSQL